MKKYDFTQIPYKDIEDNVQYFDMSKDLGNKLYYQSQDIAIAEIGKKIYHQGIVELAEKEAEAVKSVASQYPAIIRTALLNMLE